MIFYGCYYLSIPRPKLRFNLTTVEVRTCMNHYIPTFYVNEITYPCHELDAGLASYSITFSEMVSWASSLYHAMPNRKNMLCIIYNDETYPDSKVHGANMGPIWGRQDPGGPHVGPMNFVSAPDGPYVDPMNFVVWSLRLWWYYRWHIFPSWDRDLLNLQKVLGHLAQVIIPR